MDRNGYSDIIGRVNKIRARYRFISIVEAFATGSAAACVFFIVFGLLESLYYLPPKLKTPFFILAVCSFPLVFTAILLKRLIINKTSETDLARKIEVAYPSFNDRLISAVQLGKLENSSLGGQSSGLVNALIMSLADDVERVKSSVVIPVSQVKNPLRSSYALIIVFLIIATLLPLNFIGGLYRLSDFRTAYFAPNRSEIHLIEHDEMILKGDDFTIRGLISGERINGLDLVYRFDDSGSWTVRPVPTDDESGVFLATVEKPSRSFVVYLETGNVRTAGFTVDVIERPDIDSITSELTLPAYTGLSQRSGPENSGVIRSLTGTVVSMTVTANKPLRSLKAVWSDSTTSEFAVEGNHATASFTVASSLDYHFELVDTLGIANRNPISYRLTALTDEPPNVAVLAPPHDATLPITLAFPLVYSASDDYGLTKILLHYKLPFEENEREVLLTANADDTYIDSLYEWDMSDAGLLPGDVVEYSLTVYDNDTVNGPKKYSTELRTLRIPSMDDYYSDLNEKREENVETLRDLSDRAVKDGESLENVRKNIIDGEEMDWSDKNALEGAKENMESMQKDLGKLSEDLRNVADTLSDEDMAAVETIERYRKIAELMDEIAEGELKEALKRMTQANVNVDPKSLKDALENQKISAEDIQKKLDRIISLLEQVQTIQRFETSKRMLEELAAEQAEISSEYRENPDDSALERRQEKLAAEMEKLKEEIAETMGELAEQFGMDTKELQESLDAMKLPQTMRDAASDMKSGENASAKDNMDIANLSLSDLMEQMQAMSEMMSESNSEEMKKRLFLALNSLLAVSDKQEMLVYAESPSGSIFEIEPARRELEIIDSFTKARKSVESLAELNVELSQAYYSLLELIDSSMKSAVDAYSTNNGRNGDKAAGNALGDVNRAIYVLTELLSGGQEGGGQGMPGDLMQMLQKIGQGQLSMQMQMQGNMTGEQLMQLAAEQQKLAQMMSDLAEKLGGQQRLQEMLEKLSGDMDDAASMMSRNEPRELIERKQADIYRRLLDARRSKREKDEREERKSFTAERNGSKGGVLPADLGEKQRFLNERLDRAMKDDFDAEYQSLIQRYFESMLKDYGQSRREGAK